MSDLATRPATPIERVAGTALREGLTTTQTVQAFVCDCTTSDHPAVSREPVRSTGYGRLYVAVYGSRWHVVTRDVLTVLGAVEEVA